MEASTGPPPLPAPPPQQKTEKIRQKLLQEGVAPTPKIIHTIRKKELQKLNRRLAKQAAKQPLPVLTDSQQQLLAEESHFKTIKSEYKNFRNAISGAKKMVGRPWERLERLKLRELASENKEYGGDKLKTEHLIELSDIMESEKEKFHWLLDDDIEVEKDWLDKERSTWVPPKHCRSEAETIDIFLERLDGSEPRVKDWKFSKIMKLSGLQFTEKQMLKVVEGLGERGKWRHALSVVEWVYSSREHRHFRSRFVYTKLLAILGKARRPHEVLRIFNFMRGDGHIYPDMPAYHSVAVALGQAGLLKELLKVIECMKEKPKIIKNRKSRNWNPELQPDVIIFNAVLNACVPSHQWKGVSWVFQQLRKSGLRPNGATYGLSMEVMLQSGKYDLVYEFFGKMKRSGEDLKALTYKVLVKAFWAEGKVSEAIQAVREMEDRGIIGTACVYYELARCLCFHGRCQEAIMEVEKLKNVHRTRPVEVTFTGMILAAMDGGNLNGCLAIFEHCKRCCSPDIGVINAMLKVYGLNDMFLEARELFEEIRRDYPGSGIFQNCWASSLSPDIYTFSLMLEVSASAMQWEYFEYVYKEMTLGGHKLHQNKHASMLVEASRAGKWHLLEHAFNTVLEDGEVPHPTFFTEMVCQAVIQHDHERAATLVNTMAHAPFRVSEKQWIELFEENEDRISRASLRELSDALCSHHLANEATVLNFTRALQFLCGPSSLSSSLDLISSGNNLTGLLPPDGCDQLSDGTGSINPNIAGVNPPKSLQVNRNDRSSFDGLSSYNNGGNGSASPHIMLEHSGNPFASTDFGLTYWESNSSDIKCNDLGACDDDDLEFEVSASGHSDSRGSNVPSADEILKSWKEMRQTDGNFFSLPVVQNQIEMH
ncbi:pentatricopeptide repeat-containing protein At5g67570, chloroplastic [Coffea eugenioides]|uniref:pentatricopeptide repeat-containing protein At5g67570, chloroplastic n=1 Tax=Coffea eugenioides TaxID=49369 RepID=UPI000F6089CC|nr:pentatricopeptide repeat-containing protein At5g67570, chloroplastic [Coffea eugenioides]